MASANRLQGQIAIVTGSSSGIGKAVALAMASEGASVVVNHSGRSADAANQVADEIKSSGGNAIVIQADVSNEDDVKKMFAKAIETYGTVDILVNNAGLQKDAAFVDMRLEQWKTV